MNQLVFYYGAMGSQKTARALMTEYNYREKGFKTLLLKPSQDTRDGRLTIRSRTGLSAEAEILENFLEEYKKDQKVLNYADILIIDEVQFAKEEDIDLLAEICDFHDKTILCFGLRADFQNHFFPGSRRLMEIADELVEMKTLCFCGRPAICNARYDKNGIVREGKQVDLGADDKYTSLCRKHFKMGKLC